MKQQPISLKALFRNSCVTRLRRRECREISRIFRALGMDRRLMGVSF